MTLSVFNIPSGVPFARVLAKGLLAEAGKDPLALTRMRILLPTRRACRTVREAFLQESGGKPLLLPKLQPLGDVEEDELLIGLAGTDLAEEIAALPPAMPPLRRHILLARAIGKMKDFTQNQELALVLAGDLAALMDQVHTEGLDFSALPNLVEERFARHWQLTTEFLKILSEVWPGILQAHGAIDAADRRNRLLHILATHWTNNPPSSPVIAAGSTGSIPAVADLLGVIARMESGRVVLPGLDQEMDDQSWASVDDTHPQAILKILLERIGCTRANVKPWAALDSMDIQAPRRALATEIMRPAATSDEWNGLKGRDDLHKAIVRLERLDCENQEQEARAIALIFRHTLETDGKTAALVTSDRKLSRRVISACRRWGINVDDSAGQRLHETPVGLYLRLVMQAANERLAPGALLGLVRHDLCSAGLSHAALEKQAGVLEKTLLRGPKPPPGFDGLRNRAAFPLHPSTDAGAVETSLTLLDRLEPALSPLLALCESGEHPADLWIQAHLKAAEALASSEDREGAERLWQGEAGEEAARFFASLLEESGSFPAMDGIGYLSALTVLLSNCSVRPRYGAHPRLAILGQLEARLLQADTIIFGGLNEGSWPQDPGNDPWMSRPMRRQFGLPSPESSIGLAAHDFVQGFCAPHVVLTRPIRLDNAPTIPSRWLQRMDTVLQAAGIDALPPSSLPWLALARGMDHTVETRPCGRPEPRPPLDKRPSELPVTQIETWLKDPYSLYAKYVLGLRKLDDLEKAPDASSRGNFLHHVLNEFVQDYPDSLPQHAEQILIDKGLQHFRALMDDSGFWRYWLPRFSRIAGWIARHEADWRDKARNAATEIKGQAVFDVAGAPFTLTARADRIDRFRAGGMAVIDYKTGGVNLNKSAMKDGRSPQLPLEGMIVNEGGFGDKAQGETRYLGYWKLTGGLQEGDEIAIEDDDVAAAIAQAKAGLLALIEAYRDPSTPYLSLPDPERVPRFQDYAHLARVQEWSVADDAEGAE